MSTAKKPITRSGFVAYYRVSDVKQEKSGLGLEAQRAAVARYVEGKGQPILAEFTEVESGKADKNRPQLHVAIAAAKKRKAVLLIAKLDRLARNVHFISGLMESAAEFVAVDLPDANKLTIHIMAAMAEHEREMIASRTAAGLEVVKRELAEKGFRISNRGHRFTRLGNPRWEESIAHARAARIPAKAAAETTARIEAMRKEGMSLRAIAARLNEAGLKTPSGAAWYASTVRAEILAA